MGGTNVTSAKRGHLRPDKTTLSLAIITARLLLIVLVPSEQPTPLISRGRLRVWGSLPTKVYWNLEGKCPAELISHDAALHIERILGEEPCDHAKQQDRI